MPRVSPNQTNFSGGEFSPLLVGRVDSDRYKTGLKLCEGYVATLQGPLKRAPGRKFVARTAVAGSKVARLQRFEFSTTQAFMLEFSDLKLRIYKNHAPVLLAAQDITDITNDSPAVVTYDGADTYANGDEIEIAGVVGMTQVNGRRFTVANVDTGANTFELSGIDSTDYGSYTSGGTVAEVYTVTSPYAEADLFQLKFTQSADVLYIAHPDYAPRKLIRTSDTSWAFSTITFLDGPYLPVNTGTTTITPSGTTGAITLTASAALWASTDVGRIVRLRHTSTWGYALITAFTSNLIVDATVVSAFGATTATAFWRLGTWGTNQGFPRTVTFHGDRLCWGGAPLTPQRFDGSKVSDYENMAPSATDNTVADDNAIGFTLNSNDVQVILWMESEESGLVIGTASGEWLVRPSTTGGALTPTNVDAKQATYEGSADIQPVRAGKSVLYVQASARKIEEVSYIVDLSGLRSSDMTEIAEHITEGGVVQLAFTKQPQPIVWAARADGKLLGMTYRRDIAGNLHAGWHRHTLGGTSDSGGTAACVESVASIPSPAGDYNELWMVVKRYIGAATIRTVEYMTKYFEDSDAAEDQYFLDCGTTYDGSAATVITGAWHLEGETVSVLADGAVRPDVTVEDGQFTLATAASVVHYGYGYNTKGQRMRDEAGSVDGTSIGKLRRSNSVALMVHRSGGMKIGMDFEHMDRLLQRSAGDDLGAAVPLFTGIKESKLDSPWGTETEFCFEQDQPLNSTVLAIMPQLMVTDKG